MFELRSRPQTLRVTRTLLSRDWPASKNNTHAVLFAPNPCDGINEENIKIALIPPVVSLSSVALYTRLPYALTIFTRFTSNVGRVLETNAREEDAENSNITSYRKIPTSSSYRQTRCRVDAYNTQYASGYMCFFLLYKHFTRVIHDKMSQRRKRLQWVFDIKPKTLGISATLRQRRQKVQRSGE